MSHVDEGRLHAYLDGALSEPERAEVERHLLACERCRAALDEADGLLRRSHELLERIEPASVRAVSWGEIEARGTARRARASRRRIVRGVAWAASLVLAFSAGWLMNEPERDEARAFGLERMIVTGAAAEAAFLEIDLPEAAAWLAAPVRTLPDLDLWRVEVGPGTGARGTAAGRPVVRLVYGDATGHEIVLTQQHTGEPEPEEPALVVEPSGMKTYRWRENGYRLALAGDLASDSLRALAERLR